MQTATSCLTLSCSYGNSKIMSALLALGYYMITINWLAIPHHHCIWHSHNFPGDKEYKKNKTENR
jgi:hypothetical protein